MAIDIDKNTAARPGSGRSLNLQINLSGGNKVTARDRMFFVEQLALMLETGSDLHRSLAVLKKQTDNKEMQRIIEALSGDISEGKTFSSALARHPGVFSSTYVSLVAASENGGYIRQILEHLLSMEKQRDELRATLVSAATYPVFLMVFSFAIVLFILAVVFPKFAEMFASIHNQLPVTTRFLMTLSHLVVDYWWAILAGAAVVTYATWSWLGSGTGRRVMDGVKLKTPAIRQVFIKLYLIQTMRVIGLSVNHGVNLIEALELAKDAVRNRIYHDFIDGLIRDVTEGRKLAGGFNKVGFVPPIVQQMITTGEETGNLGLVSIRIADYFQKELERLLELFAKTIEPLMLIVMGVIVGILVSSLILPIFKLSHAVH